MKRSSRAIAKQVIAAAKWATTSSSESSSCSKHRSTTTMMTSLAVSTSSCQERQMQCQRYEHQAHHITNPSPPPPSPAAASDASVIITPPPSPQLLLEGDNMYISSDGKAHTYYRLHSSSSSAASSSNHNEYVEYLIEEAYDIEHARKEITLLHHHHSASSNNNHDDDATMCTTTTATTSQPTQLTKIITFPLQEIITNFYYYSTKTNNKTDRTGSTTWDSSIIMSFYFGQHPKQLNGNVLELGSGVGLGAILTRILSNTNCCCHKSNNDAEEDQHHHQQQQQQQHVTSFTLSEINRDILNMLQYNTAAAAEAISAASSDCTSSIRNVPIKFHIERLDWFDFVGTNDTAATANYNNATRKQYDTIIASDCIYLASQIRPLSETIVKLLRRRPQQRQEGKGGGGSNQDIPKAHIFSPYNRGVIPDLIQTLRTKEELIVDVETMELSKFRVKSNDYDDWTDGNVVGKDDVSRLNWLLGDDDTDDKRQDVMSSCCISKFLHITVSFRNDDGVKECKNDSDMSMTGID